MASRGSIRFSPSLPCVLGHRLAFVFGLGALGVVVVPAGHQATLEFGISELIQLVSISVQTVVLGFTEVIFINR